MEFLFIEIRIFSILNAIELNECKMYAEYQTLWNWTLNT